MSLTPAESDRMHLLGLIEELRAEAEKLRTNIRELGQRADAYHADNNNLSAVINDLSARLYSAQSVIGIAWQFVRDAENSVAESVALPAQLDELFREYEVQSRTDKRVGR